MAWTWAGLLNREVASSPVNSDVVGGLLVLENTFFFVFNNNLGYGWEAIDESRGVKLFLGLQDGRLQP